MSSLVVALVAVLAAAAPAVADPLTAAVSTWDGASWRLTETSLETLSTVLPDPAETPPRALAAPAGPVGGASAQSLLAFFDATKAPAREAQDTQIFQARRVRTLLTIVRAGAELQIPLAAVDTVVFAREPVAESSLPPWFAADHFRHSVSVRLRDGSVLDGDYVNLGTTVLRGRAGETSVEIPWDAIQSVRFER